MGLLKEARELEKEARARLGEIPMMARVMYPEYVKAGEVFCDRLTQLVRDLEAAEAIAK
ncbi:MAG: hypothetical protein AAGC78_10385 [Cellvibrio sp.]|uniref:hypothetical protein n=1 Tax=Cellvibrio sp. TaxID=1965322 RepID=UPI0031A90B16